MNEFCETQLEAAVGIALNKLCSCAGTSGSIEKAGILRSEFSHLLELYWNMLHSLLN